MYEYIIGEITELTPAYVTIETGNIGYFINISVNTYSELSEKTKCKLFLHQVVRDDAHLLFGFINTRERYVFRSLITVSGIGANTARMMLSSLTPDEIRQAIVENNVILLKSIKGIGAKTAQRVIIDLRDKLGIMEETSEIFVSKNNTIKEEALSALVMLGFTKRDVEKVLDKILNTNRDFTVEELVKASLK
ncbi:Holliday junction branch migration protein RuvA, partial [Bacteroidota bacterium]